MLPAIIVSTGESMRQSHGAWVLFLVVHRIFTEIEYRQRHTTIKIESTREPVAKELDSGPPEELQQY